MGVALSPQGSDFSPNSYIDIKEHPGTTSVEQLWTSFELCSMTSSSHLVSFLVGGIFLIPIPSREATACKLMLVTNIFSPGERTVLIRVFPMVCLFSMFV